MALAGLMTIVLVMLATGYFSYGRFVARQFRIDDAAATPAVVHNDDQDFVPTPRGYLFGQHFSAIAAAGPIAGPILAGQQFGWLPCVLWIVIGVIFIGAVHDMSILMASVRHDGSSIAEVVRAHMGARAWKAMLIFIWLALVYVIVAFCDIVAQTFVSRDADLEGLEFAFNPGGAVAFASVAYLSISVVMGLLTRALKPPLWLMTLIFVPATLACVWFGTQHSGALALSGDAARTTWGLAILGYCFIASLTPVWALLQPRGYLGGFVLYLALAAGVIGIFFGGFDVQLPAFKGFAQPGATGLLFPFLFVTIACGACSGFHGLVCSGTTSKQIARESDVHPVGYGAMLMEAVVAVIALSTLMIAAPESLVGKAPGAVYGEGLGRFVAVIIGEEHLLLATTFGAMAFSTFVFDTLDVSTRLGRYLLQELFGATGRTGALIATAVTCGVPAVFLVASGENAYRTFWTLFGTSNQLLAALSLLGITVWLKAMGRTTWFTVIPMILVFLVTVSSLVLLLVGAFTAPSMPPIAVANALIGAALLALALSFTVSGVRTLLGRQAA